MKFVGKVVLAAVVAAVSAVSAERTGPWSREKAWEWYGKQPWMRGCNYMPASAANRVDQWQALGSEERFEEVERELTLAESIGFNTLRILVEECGFGVWYHDRKGFMERFERYLRILDRHRMRAIIVLGNDCSRPKPLWKLPKPGPQPCDWGYHGGRKLSQHGSFRGQIGYTSLDDPELNPKFYEMCEEILVKYRDDRRIAFWNLWNEPGGNGRGTVSAPHVQKLFELAWKIDPVQPLAADVWSQRGDYGHDAEKNPAQAVAAKNSDIISYHCYGDYETQVLLIAKLRRYYGRPMVNTEWLARTIHNDVFSSYPLFYIQNVGCTCWGFVAGRYQTYEPWETMWKEIEKGRGRNYDMTKWFHDLYRPSLRPYDPKEIELIEKFNRLADEDFARVRRDEGPASAVK